MMDLYPVQSRELSSHLILPAVDPFIGGSAV